MSKDSSVISEDIFIINRIAQEVIRFWKNSGFIGSVDIGELMWDLVNPFDLLYGELGDGTCGPNGYPLPSKEELDNVPWFSKI